MRVIIFLLSLSIVLMLPVQGFTQSGEKSGNIYTTEKSTKFPGGVKETTTRPDGSTYVTDTNKDNTKEESINTYPNGKPQSIHKDQKNPDGTSNYDFIEFDEKGKVIANAKGKSVGSGPNLKITSLTEDLWKFDDKGRATQH